MLALLHCWLGKPRFTVAYSDELGSLEGQRLNQGVSEVWLLFLFVGRAPEDQPVFPSGFLRQGYWEKQVGCNAGDSTGLY